MIGAQAADIEAIKILKARYCRYADAKQWADYFRLFAEDFVFEVSAGAAFDADDGGTRFGDSGLQQGRENFSRWVLATSAPIEASVHHCHLPEIEITGPDSARGVWALEDRLYFALGHSHRAFHGFGYYDETYQRIDGLWRFKTMRLSRLKVSLESW